MNFKYYDSYENLVKRLKRESIKAEEVISEYVEKPLPIRSFSRTFMPGNCCQFNIKQEYLYLEEKLENICKEYSDKEIQAIINDMKIIKWYSAQNKNTLKNIAIIWRDHFLEENIGLLNGFVEMGVDPRDIFALDKGDSTEHHHEIWETFKKMGFKVDILDNALFDDNKEIIKAKKLIFDFIEEKKDKKIIILDDGAIISTLLNDTYKKNVVGILELTEMGLRRIKGLTSEPIYPILNIAKTSLKRNITYVEIANSIFFRIIQLLGAEKLVGRKVILCGYGDMGEILADKLQKFGIRVVVYDPDIMKLIIASERGFNTYDNIENAVKKENPFLIIGASGYRSITNEVINTLKDGSYVTAGATADLQVLKELEKQNNVKVETVSNIGTQYLIDNSKRITMLGNGRSVNLFNSEAIPNKSNDVFKASMLVAAKQLINEKNKIPNNVCLEQVEEWIKESKILNKYYDLYLK